MRIKWLGHSCFMITNEAGVRILTDPCDPDTGYQLRDIETDILTVSHSHHDHCYTDAVKGTPVTLTDAGEYEVCGIKIRGISSYHDDCFGRKRGTNTIFCFETDGIKVVHMGDIGYFDDTLTEKIGETDVLLVPIGGIYTIDASQARELANRLNCKVLIPMHYKTPALNFELDDIDEFISSVADCSIHRLGKTEAVLNKEYMDEKRVLILSYK